MKIDVKKTNLLRLGINGGEEVMLGNGQIVQVDSFSNLGSTISKDGLCSDDSRSRIAKGRCVFSHLKRNLRRRR